LLEAGYGRRAPARAPLWRLVRLPQPPGRISLRARLLDRWQHWYPWSMVAPAAVYILIVVLASGVAAALTKSPAITDLGKPTNDVPQYLPLGGFRHMKKPLVAGKVPTLLFMGTQIDDGSAAERWPVVKALAQFGTLTGVRPSMSRTCANQYDPVTIDCTAPEPPYTRDYVTYDFDSGRYTSKYLHFQSVDFMNRSGQLRPVPRNASSIFKRYLSVPGASLQRSVLAAMQGGIYQHPGRRFPLVAIGSYMQRGNNVAIPGDIQLQTVPQQVTFDDVQKTMRTGKTQAGVSATLLRDFNAEANVITALICRADGLKPHSVCGRPAIRLILKHVKR
jgi:hypothetical protein